MVELSGLPPELLEILFQFLDAQMLVTVTECCRLFNEIISNSERLTKKLTLVLRYPQDLNDNFADSINRSNRRYRKLCIIKSRDRICDFSNQNATIRMFTKLGGMIRDLSIDWSNALRPREATLLDMMNRRRGPRVGGYPALHFDNVAAAEAYANVREDIYNEFVNIISNFTNLEKMSLMSVHLERERFPIEREIQFRSLRDLKVTQCDAFCFNLLSFCRGLEKLNVADPWWNQRDPGIETFETFLVNQTSLKDLRLKNFQYPRLFQTDRTSQIVFKLDTLVLKSVFFSDKEIATKFFQAQNELKIIDFQLQNEKVRGLDNMQWYNNILRTMVTRNHQLHTIKIAKLRYKIENCDFITNIKNPFVKKLEFSVSSEDKSSDLFKKFIGIFPNLIAVTFKADESEETVCGICFEEGTLLDKVESLAIFNSSVRSLMNVFAPSLKNFEYVPGKTGEFIDDLFGGFFHRHRTIKHLVIGNRSERSYFFVSYNLCHLIVNFLTQLESITIYNFEGVNKSVKLLCNLRKLKTLTLSSEDYQQFTAKTKVECARSNLKLIHVAIPNNDRMV